MGSTTATPDTNPTVFLFPGDIYLTAQKSSSSSVSVTIQFLYFLSSEGRGKEDKGGKV